MRWWEPAYRQWSSNALASGRIGSFLWKGGRRQTWPERRPSFSFGIVGKALRWHDENAAPAVPIASVSAPVSVRKKSLPPSKIETTRWARVQNQSGQGRRRQGQGKPVQGIRLHPASIQTFPEAPLSRRATPIRSGRVAGHVMLRARLPAPPEPDRGFPSVRFAMGAS